MVEPIWSFIESKKNLTKVMFNFFNPMTIKIMRGVRGV